MSQSIILKVQEDFQEPDAGKFANVDSYDKALQMAATIGYKIILINRWTFPHIPKNKVASFDVVLDSILNICGIQKQEDFWPGRLNNVKNNPAPDPTTPEIARINVICASIVDIFVSEHQKFIEKAAK